MTVWNSGVSSTLYTYVCYELLLNLIFTLCLWMHVHVNVLYIHTHTHTHTHIVHTHTCTHTRTHAHMCKSILDCI